MNNAIIPFVLVLLLSTVAFSEYRANVTVQVISKDGYLVNGAEVIFKNELTKVQGSITSRPYLTNSSGTVTALIYNNEFDSRDMDTSFEAIVRYGNVAKTIKDDAIDHKPVLTVQLPIYLVNIDIIDEKGLPAVGAVVETNGMRFDTDASGTLTELLPEGIQELTAVYKGLTSKQKLKIEKGTKSSIYVIAYTAKVYIVDSDRKPMKGGLYYRNKFYEVPVEGVEIIFGEDSNPVIKAVYSGREKQVTLNLALEKVAYIPFDIKEPGIEGVSADYENSTGRFSLKAIIEDTGTYKSGLKDVFVYYDTAYESGNSEMYVEQGNTYVTNVKLKQRPFSIGYEIRATDKELNTMTYKGVLDLKPEVNESSVDSGGTQQNQGNNTLIYVIVAVVVLVIAYLVYKKMSSDSG